MRIGVLLTLTVPPGALVAAMSLASQPGESPNAEIGRVLDAFHAAAAAADEDTYFGLIAESGVFLGTDQTERWTKAEFHEWAAPYFQRDSAWTYHAVERHVSISPEGGTAWFDEIVRNESYGDLRGSGVLVREDGRWLIRQYNLTFLVPNDIAEDVVRMTREHLATQDR